MCWRLVARQWCTTRRTQPWSDAISSWLVLTDVARPYSQRWRPCADCKSSVRWTPGDPLDAMTSAHPARRASRASTPIFLTVARTPKINYLTFPYPSRP